jgi:hypothetical protein
VTLYLDNEDDDNRNTRSGWMGASEQGRNTRLHSCRVDGSRFQQDQR